MCDSKRDVRRNKTVVEFLRSLARDSGGAVAIYIAIAAPVMLGVGALSMDLGRLMTLNTELQGAADAAALAGARELDRFPGAMAKASAAAVGAITNSQTFATDGGGKQVLIDATPCADPPVAPCMRFLKSLPADDGDPITAANVTTIDAEARFIDVHVGARSITNILVRIVGGPGTASTSAAAVAGNDQVVCKIPPMFMCNPSEGAGNTDLQLPVDINALEGRQLELFHQGGGGSLTPGNFGLLCPTGTEGATNCGGSAVKDALASTTGTCISLELTTTKTGVTLEMVRTGINARFDYWTPQAKDTGNDRWRDRDEFMPAANVTQGGDAPAGAGGGQATCEYSAIDPAEGMGQPRDQCHIDDNCNYSGNSRIGDGNWDHLEYFRINHGCNQSTNPTCKPGDWDALTGTANWPPTRYQTYRYELERTPEVIVEPNQTIYDVAGNAVETTEEDGHTQCFQGTPPPIPGYNYFPAKVRDLKLLGDRRVLPLAIANCNALEAAGISTSGKFSFRPPEFVYVFLSEPMKNPSDSEIYAEILGALDEGAVDSLSRDIIQLYRR
jgi:Flp pilus assembly protein TadG